MIIYNGDMTNKMKPVLSATATCQIVPSRISRQGSALHSWFELHRCLSSCPAVLCQTEPGSQSCWRTVQNKHGKTCDI